MKFIIQILFYFTLLFAKEIKINKNRTLFFSKIKSLFTKSSSFIEGFSDNIKSKYENFKNSVESTNPANLQTLCNPNNIRNEYNIEFKKLETAMYDYIETKIIHKFKEIESCEFELKLLDTKLKEELTFMNDDFKLFDGIKKRLQHPFGCISPGNIEFIYDHMKKKIKEYISDCEILSDYHGKAAKLCDDKVNDRGFFGKIKSNLIRFFYWK